MRSWAVALLMGLFACGGNALRAGGGDDFDAGTDAGPDAGPVCGNGLREGAEECDQGADNGPNKGCERDCTRSCVPGDALRGDSHCDPHDKCKGVGICEANYTCEVDGGLPGGSTCDASGDVCRGGACQQPVCGDGIVTAPEECDDGVNDGTRGCNSHCLFVCVSTDTTRNCTSGTFCAGIPACNDSTHLCTKPLPEPDGTPCGSDMTCRSAQCLPDFCGDGHLDSGEQCDPPDGVTCDSNCQRIVCGDGKRGGQEQCDDGNTANLDGCDSHCRFEEAQRSTSVTMLFGTDSFCAANALGSAIGSNAQPTIQSEIAAAVSDGSMNMMFQVLRLADTTGQSGALALGAVTGTPYPAPGLGKYNGNKDTDWWYATDRSEVDGALLPTSQIAASISAANLATTSPGHMDLVFVLGAGPVKLKGSGVRVKASIGPSTAPPISLLAETPGHLSSERLDPELRAFASMTNGELCGNISAGSLSSTPVAAALLSGGSLACGEGYTSANSMLDVLFNGCTFLASVGGFPIPITIVAATDPDQVDPQAPVAGAGAPYSLSSSVFTGKVNKCQDKNGATVTLSTCLNAVAYSAALQFATDRVILK
jgi:cysteine-rich repeat protein